jgi:hypothetical protein
MFLNYGLPLLASVLRPACIAQRRQMLKGLEGLTDVISRYKTWKEEGSELKRLSIMSSDIMVLEYFIIILGGERVG